MFSLLQNKHLVQTSFINYKLILKDDKYQICVNICNAKILIDLIAIPTLKQNNDHFCFWQSLAV